MGFTICPLLGVGALRFGMTPEEVRRLLPTPHRSFMKARWSKMPTDAFADAIHVFYDDSGRCDAVEFYRDCEVLLNEKNLLGIPYSDAQSVVRAIDPELEEDEAGFTSYRLGVGAYAPVVYRISGRPN